MTCKLHGEEGTTIVYGKFWNNSRSTPFKLCPREFAIFPHSKQVLAYYCYDVHGEMVHDSSKAGVNRPLGCQTRTINRSVVIAVEYICAPSTKRTFIFCKISSRCFPSFSATHRSALLALFLVLISVIRAAKNYKYTKYTSRRRRSISEWKASAPVYTQYFIIKGASMSLL